MSNNEYKGTKYPKDVAAVVRDQTLSVASELFLATAAEGYSPLTIFNDFSRFVVTVINEGRVPAFANIPVEEWANIRELTRIAQKMDVEAKYAPAPAAPATAAAKTMPSTEAYTVKMTEGRYAGQTPAEVLIKDKAAVGELGTIFKSMRDRYQANKDESLMEQMKAIKEAADRLKAGTLEQEDDGTDGPAYTVRIANGNLKGKTPAEVLIEDAAGKKALLSQREWLAKNMEKYPANKTQVEAIDQAIRLFEEGKLSGAAASTAAPASGRTINLYEAKYRPLTRRQKENGKCLVYEIVINWTIGNDYPVSVKVQNYYAPVIKNEKTGMLNVKASEAEDKVQNEMLLMAKEWNNVLDRIYDNMLQFKVLHARETINDSIAADKKNREAAGVEERRN